MAREHEPGKFDLESIAARLEADKLAQADGRVGFIAGHFEDYSSILLTAIDFHPEIPHHERSKIIDAAIFEAGKTQITKDSILDAAKKLEIEYLRKPFQEYRFIAQMSISRFGEIENKRVKNVAMKFMKRLPELPDRLWKRFTDQFKNIVYEKVYKDYSFCECRLSARTEEAAGYEALEAIDFCRGIWNLYFNHRVWRSQRSPDRRPVNEILLGTLHCVTDREYSTYFEMYWYNIDIGRQFMLKDLTGDASKLIKFEEAFRKQLNRSPREIREFVRQCVRKYCETLDISDPEQSFQRIWGLLENLTLLQQRENYEDVIHRALVVAHSKDRPMFKQILKHLRERRNELIHHGAGHRDANELLFQVKWFVERLLFFFLRIGPRLKKLSSIREFMDIPDAETLKENIKRMTLQLKKISK